MRLWWVFLGELEVDEIGMTSRIGAFFQLGHFQSTTSTRHATITFFVFLKTDISTSCQLQALFNDRSIA
jgi:hypothetical protein